jgi:integrase
MSSEENSRKQASADLTLADALTAVQAADLRQRRRQEMSSALRTVSRALGKRLEDIPARPRLLAERLKLIAPDAIGISRRRWNNIRSLTQASLMLVQSMAPGRNLNKPSPGWQRLADQLPSESVKRSISRLMRFCSARGIEPEAVTEETFQLFEEHLNDSLKIPRKVLSVTQRGWRRAQDAVADWPKAKFETPDRRRCWTLPFAAFPASFANDCERWLNKLAGRDLIEETSFPPVCVATLTLRQRQVRSFASALTLQGRDPKTITSLTDLVEIGSFKDGLRFYLARRGKVTSSIVDLAICLVAIARHHVQVDLPHLNQMRSITRRLARGLSGSVNGGLTATNRKRLLHFDDSEKVRALLSLPERLMARAKKTRNRSAAARLAQTAAAIEILLMAPMRLKNLANLDLERNLIRLGDELHIIIEPEEVKNRAPLQFPLPQKSAVLIGDYVRQFRQTLNRCNGGALFPGRTRGAKRQHVLGKQISKVIYSYTGLEVHTHLFRHIAAKLFLDANPGCYEVVRLVLGHKSMKTTLSFYTGLEHAAAARHFDANVLRLRRQHRVQAGKFRGKKSGARRTRSETR